MTMVLVDADPYPWPWDGDLGPAGTALVVAGAQRAWAEASSGAESVAAVIGSTAAALRAAGGLVVVLRHAAPPARPGARPSSLPPGAGSDGWAPAFDPEPEDLVVDCGGVCGFTASGLDIALRTRGVSRLVCVGYGAEAAVDSTVRRANDMGYECLTLTDGCAPFDPGLGAHALSSVTMSGGIFGAVAPSSAFLSALSARSPAAPPVLEVVP